MGIKEKLSEKWKTPYFQEKLKKIAFNDVGLRGVKNTSIKFDYPITAIAGANAIGKTTILQLIAYLYHNDDTTHKLYRFSNAKNAKSYYTFGDFFIHFRGEEKSEGASIVYEYEQKGKKKPITKTHTLSKGKQWNAYNRRPKRATDFYGVSRVIPANEFAINTFTSSVTAFKKGSLSDESTKMIRSILCKPLSSVDSNALSKIPNFKLNTIKLESGLSYSNFNMGAGEEVIIAIVARMAELADNLLTKKTN